jgi:hypothetical protein
MVVVAGAIATLCFLLIKLYRSDRWPDQLSAQSRSAILDHEAHERAELLLRASTTPQEYSSLLQYGYLEIPSRLYHNRIYQIPRERRRVRVYEVTEGEPARRFKKLGELCVVACDPVPEADLILTHKWLIEADEERYIATANWISGSWIGGAYA